MKLSGLVTPLLCIPVLWAAVEYSPAGRDWWAHVQFLADDKLEGRNTGTPGHRKAAEYVAKQYDTIGLKAAGTKGFFQPVGFRSRQIVEPKSKLELVHDGKVQAVKLGEEAAFSLRIEPSRSVEAEAVFVGYGLKVPEARHDDLTGQDLRGKIAVMLAGAPRRIAGPLAAHVQSAAERWATLKAAGAIGTISFPNPKHMDIPWDRAAPARLLASMSLADPKLEETAGQQVSIGFNPAKAEMLFAGTGHSVAEILALDDAQKPLPKFPLKVKVRSQPEYEVTEAISDNVAGLIPGSDAKLRNEYVVLTAHLDHLGLAKSTEGDRVHNGAMDNASGIATLIEVGKKLAKGNKPKRSVILLAVTAEEKGLLGSKFFANNPTIKRENIVANVNMDMFLPLVPLKSVVAYGSDESSLGPLFREIAAKHSVGVTPDREPQRNLFVRSDQYSFIRQGIPAIVFKFGTEPDTPEDKVMKDWIRTRYHGPTDDLQQPVDVEAAVKFNAMLLDFTLAVANAPERPRWNDKSFFRRFASAQ